LGYGDSDASRNCTIAGIQFSCRGMVEITAQMQLQDENIASFIPVKLISFEETALSMRDGEAGFLLFSRLALAIHCIGA